MLGGIVWLIVASSITDGYQAVYTPTVEWPDFETCAGSAGQANADWRKEDKIAVAICRPRAWATAHCTG